MGRSYLIAWSDIAWGGLSCSGIKTGIKTRIQGTGSGGGVSQRNMRERRSVSRRKRIGRNIIRISGPVLGRVHILRIKGFKVGVNNKFRRLDFYHFINYHKIEDANK